MRAESDELTTSHALAVGSLLAVMTAVAVLVPVSGRDSELFVSAASAPTTGLDAAPTPSTVPDSTVPASAVPDSTVTVPVTTVPASTVPVSTVPDSTVPDSTVPDSTVADSTVPVTAAPTSTEPRSTEPDADRAAVERIQTVPAVRDIIFEIDGRRLATDASGSITVPSELAGARLELVGLVAEPRIRSVEMIAWSDGETSPRRSLADADGPVLQLGLELSSRVFVDIDPSLPDVDEVDFVSSDGERISLPTTGPSWVVSDRIVTDGDDFGTVRLQYTIDTEQFADTVFAAATYQPRPEAVWRVTGR